MIHAGDLDRRITLKGPNDTRGDDGSVRPGYLTGDSIWAQYIAEGGREFFAAQKRNAEVSAVFKIRYRSGVNARYRVVYDSRNFDVIFVNDTGKRFGELLLECKELM